MAIEFGEVINLQPYILNWVVNGENSDKAFREKVSEKALKNSYKKITYRGKYEDFIKIGGNPLFPDRQHYSMKLNKGNILKSLVEYKKRWNINGDSALLKIDYVGFQGEWLIVKTTEAV